MAQNSSQTGGAAGASPATESAPRGRVVLLNALPLNSLPQTHLELDVLSIDTNELTKWVQRRVAEGYGLIHYIRHPATIAALRAAGIPIGDQPNSGLYRYQPGDLLVVVSLRSPQRGQEQTQVSLQDLQAWIVTVL